MGVVVYSKIPASAALDQIQRPMFVGQAQSMAAKQELLQVLPVLSLAGRVGYMYSIYSLLVEQCHFSRGWDEVEILILT